MSNKPSRYVVDDGQYVHFRWCEEFDAPDVQPYAGHDNTTAAEMLAMIKRGDSHNQFGAKNNGPSILSACSCVYSEAAEEAVRAI